MMEIKHGAVKCAILCTLPYKLRQFSLIKTAIPAVCRSLRVHAIGTFSGLTGPASFPDLLYALDTVMGSVLDKIPPLLGRAR
jgi:hypothetical protein